MSLHEFERRFAILDELPESLYQQVVTHAHGALLPRVEGILQWREALLQGTLPEEKTLAWPSPELTRTLLMRLETLDIVRYCREQEGLTDSVLETILEGVGSAEDYFSKAGAFDDKLAQQQKIRDQDSGFADDDGLADHVDSPRDAPDDEDSPPDEGKNPGDNSAQGQMEAGADLALPEERGAAESVVEIPDHGEDATLPAETPNDQMEPDANLAEDSQEAEQVVGSDPDQLAEQLDRRWGELATSWQELAAVFDELGEFLGCGWDLTQGVLSSQGWRDITRYRQLIRNLPELVRLVEIMGRMRKPQKEGLDESIIEQVIEPLQRSTEIEKKHKSTLTINTTDGIRLSDDIARMLPAESALLGHPVLNILWHAKRAESMLRCYQLQGVLSEHSPLPELDKNQSMTDEPPLAGHGPIILCLDTSASMHGEPETIAKALALEALRIAATEKRACHVYSFSGEAQLLTFELDLTQNGFKALIEFLQQSFHGGTDVVAALRAAMEKLNDEAWRQVDILLISDGRFPLPQEILPEIAQAKERHEVRIHGLLLGRWKGEAMKAICDPLHRYDLWKSLLSRPGYASGSGISL